MLSNLSRAFKQASAGALLLAGAGLYVLWPEAKQQSVMEKPVPLASVAENRPLSAEEFKQHVDYFSNDNLMVVILHRTDCGICPGVRRALEESRHMMLKKYRRGLAVYEVNADESPEVAALLRQRDPEADARMHIFFNSEKIYETKGISDHLPEVFDLMEVVQDLAVGELSVLKKYEPANIFEPPASVGMGPR